MTQLRTPAPSLWRPRRVAFHGCLMSTCQSRCAHALRRQWLNLADTSRGRPAHLGATDAFDEVTSFLRRNLHRRMTHDLPHRARALTTDSRQEGGRVRRHGGRHVAWGCCQAALKRRDGDESMRHLPGGAAPVGGQTLVVLQTQSVQRPLRGEADASNGAWRLGSASRRYMPGRPHATPAHR